MPFAVFDGDHIEGHALGYNVNTTGGSVSVRNSSISGNGCTSAITIQGTNPNNTVLVENIQTGPTTVANGHAGGCSVTGSILAQRVP